MPILYAPKIFVAIRLELNFDALESRLNSKAVEVALYGYKPFEPTINAQFWI